MDLPDRSWRTDLKGIGVNFTRPGGWRSRQARIALVLAAVAAVGAGCSSSTKSGSSPTTTAGGSSNTSGSGGSSGSTSLSDDTVTSTSVTLTGSGASSINPFFERVFYDYHQKNPKTTIHYSPAGSSVGVKDIQQNIVNFGDSEIPMSASDLAKTTAGTILQLPVDLGGVAISYNVPGAPKTLSLDGPTLAGIFDGTITKWNAPQIASVSGVSNLPDLPIIPVHRADSSGPGWNLDAYLIKTAPTWSAKTGTTKPSKTWPLATVGIGQQLNTGVANYVHQTPGAIGYVEYAYALQAGFANVALKNQSGSFVAPSIQSITAAGSQATSLSATNFSIIDQPGSGTYPLANFSWTLIYQKQPDVAKGEALGKLFHYVVTTGQSVSSSLGYAPMPANAVSLAQSTLMQMQTSTGSPLFTS
jgi:phosphate transport system substrate-binding protein